MKPITSFSELTTYVTSSDSRKRLAVANALDSHTLEAVMRSVETGFIEAFLVGDRNGIEEQLAAFKPSPFVHIVNVTDSYEATLEAVRMVRHGECDILMKGLVNTDVILRAVLDKEKGLHSPGNVLAFNAGLKIPNYHKMLFFTDPAVIPDPNKEQRIATIRYAVHTAHRFGIPNPKVALIHATEKPSPKIRYMQDYVDIMEMYRNGEFPDCIIDGPVDIFLALDKERGAIKHIPTPILGDADILIFPDFDAANVFYKGVSVFANAEMAGLLYGTDKPVVITSRSESTDSKFYSICMACVLV
ncbi:MAG: phosphate butyryltransferase [Prevotellaceae bacterium]|jgi:phosphate butyryltransferase|nr:phosphate butyryltransferase [Prevotellaceae bacterium]